MTLVSNGGFLPTNSLREIISTNYQKIVVILSLTISMLNFYLIFNIFNRRVFIKEHKEDFYLLGTAIFLILIIYLNNIINIFEDTDPILLK